MKHAQLIEFNINQYVHVKLNQTGIDELRRQHNALKQSAPLIGEFRAPKEDEAGWSKWQLHTLMERLGHLCTLGLEPPFETYIRFEVKE